MQMDRMVIAIDGPAAAGKTTVGARAAERLGWTFLDSGILYRALAWLAIDRDVALDDSARLAALAADLDVRVTRPSVRDGRLADLLIGERDVTWELRTPAVDRASSAVAALPGVRTALVPAQRSAASGGAAIVVGRDIGTIIFPDAALKVYLDATVEERARRRVEELAARGETLDLGEATAGLTRRDTGDMERAHAPLTIAPDAVRINTDGRSADEVVEDILTLWGRRAAAPRPML
jgi:cytidylate kinase